MERFLCSDCKRFYPLEANQWRCDCGSFLDLEFKPQFPVQTIFKRAPTLWRYHEAIPIHHDESILSMGEGFNPLEEMELQGKRVFIDGKGDQNDPERDRTKGLFYRADLCRDYYWINEVFGRKNGKGNHRFYFIQYGFKIWCKGAIKIYLDNHLLNDYIFWAKFLPGLS